MANVDYHQTRTAFSDFNQNPIPRSVAPGIIDKFKIITIKE
jgi:hypothetical protein